jgi:hypothetical protein
MLTAAELRHAEKALRRAGYWYPPDAIQAVHEGRDTYHPLDPKITYTIGQSQRVIIRGVLNRLRL